MFDIEKCKVEFGKCSCPFNYKVFSTSVEPVCLTKLSPYRYSKQKEIKCSWGKSHTSDAKSSTMWTNISQI